MTFPQFWVKEVVQTGTMARHGAQSGQKCCDNRSPFKSRAHKGYENCPNSHPLLPLPPAPYLLCIPHVLHTSFVLLRGVSPPISHPCHPSWSFPPALSRILSSHPTHTVTSIRHREQATQSTATLLLAPPPHFPRCSTGPPPFPLFSRRHGPTPPDKAAALSRVRP